MEERTLTDHDARVYAQWLDKYDDGSVRSLETPEARDWINDRLGSDTHELYMAGKLFINGGGKKSRKRRTKKSRTIGGKKSRKLRKRTTLKGGKRKRRRTRRRR